MKRAFNFVTLLLAGLLSATSGGAAGNFKASFYKGDQNYNSTETNGNLPYVFAFTDLGARREPFLVNNNGTVVSYVEHTSGYPSYVRWRNEAEGPLSGTSIVAAESLMPDDTVIGTVGLFFGNSSASAWAPTSSTATALPVPAVGNFTVTSEGHYMTPDGILIGHYDLVPPNN
jgi:hypothetical protein